MVMLLFLGSGCTRAIIPPVSVQASREFFVASVRTLAVMPARPAPGVKDLAAKALDSVSEILIAAAARHGGWRLVDPDKVVAAAKGSEAAVLPEAAIRVASGVGADAALTATVSRFRERVGGDYGASEASSVGLELLVVSVKEKGVVWKADYAITQEPLAYNLWNLWQVLRGGPRWLTAAELARIGIDEAVGRLAAGGPPR